MVAASGGSLTIGRSPAQRPWGDRVPEVTLGVSGESVAGGGVIVAQLGVVVTPVSGPVTLVGDLVTGDGGLVTLISVTVTVFSCVVALLGVVVAWGAVVAGKVHGSPWQGSGTRGSPPGPGPR